MSSLSPPVVKGFTARTRRPDNHRKATASGGAPSHGGREQAGDARGRPDRADRERPAVAVALLSLT